MRKYNDAIADSQRKVTLQDFLNQTGELKRLNFYFFVLLYIFKNSIFKYFRKIEEIKYFHKQELEGVSSVLNKLQEEHKDLNIKYANIYNENKKLTAENKVLDQALK